MKLFFKRLAIFFITVLAIGFLLQIVVSRSMKNKVVLNMYDNFHVSYPQKIDLLFMGSSRCITHFNPALFDNYFKIKSLNLGVDGHSDLEMHVLKLKSFLKHNKPPRIIILNFDMFITSLEVTGGKNYVHKDYFSRYAFLPFSEEPAISEYFNYNFGEKYVPSYALLKYKYIVNALQVNFDKTRNIELYERHDEQWDTIRNPVKHIKYSGNFRDPKFIRAVKGQLLIMDSICKKNDIKLILVHTPVYLPVFTGHLLDAPKLIAAELGLPYFDMNAEYISNDIRNFYNSNHLNTVGINRMFQHMTADTEFTGLIRSFIQ